jgi:uncharacterized protein (DUF1800 family)
MAAAYAGAPERTLEAPLRVLFTDEEFYSERAKNGLPRSPIDFFVGAARSFKVRTGKWFEYDVLESLATMGMDLLRPPSVGGWDWGRSWMSSMSLLERYQVAQMLAGARGGSGWGKLVPKRVVRKLPDDADAVIDRVLELAGVDPLQLADPSSVRDVLRDYLTSSGTWPVDLHDNDFLEAKVRGLVYLALILPEAQV